MSYRFADSLRAGSGRNSVYSKEPLDDGRRNCPKHVEFYSKNKFEKSVRLVGFIIRIYHDARSPERQIFSLNIESLASQSKMKEKGVELF